MSFSDVIKSNRAKKGLTLAEIAKYMGVTEATVQRWESGNIKNIKYERLVKLSNILGIDPAELMGWNSEKTPSCKAVKIPVLGYVKAGIPMEAIENIIDYEEISEEMTRTGEFFGLKVKGDSMEPKISEGDVVIVRKQETVENGEIAVVLINGDEATIKRFYKSPLGITLMSTNTKYGPFNYTPEEVDNLPITVIGKVVELRAKF